MIPKMNSKQGHLALASMHLPAFLANSSVLSCLFPFFLLLLWQPLSCLGADCAFTPICLNQAKGGSQISHSHSFPAPSTPGSGGEHSRMQSRGFCLWLSGKGRKAPLLLCLLGDCIALAEEKEKDQPASKVEAKLFALLKGLVKEADSQLDRKVSNKQC